MNRSQNKTVNDKFGGMRATQQCSVICEKIVKICLEILMIYDEYK